MLELIIGIVAIAALLSFINARILKLPGTFGVMTLSTFILGTVFFYITQNVGLPGDYLYCLVFGALISPTNVVAMLEILRKVNTPKSIEIELVSESLYNDCAGIVVFLPICSIPIALPVPESDLRDVIVRTTYTVMVFSVVVQGLTIENIFLKSFKPYL